MSTCTQGVATKMPHPPVPSSMAAGLRDPYMSACHRGSIKSSWPRRSNWTGWLRHRLPGAGRGPPSPIPRTGCPSRPNDRLPSGSNTSVCTGWPAAFVTTTVRGFGRTSTRRVPTLAATARAVVWLSPVSMMRRRPSAWSSRIASGVDVRMGSATPISPATCPSTATSITVIRTQRTTGESGSNQFVIQVV